MAEQNGASSHNGAGAASPSSHKIVSNLEDSMHSLQMNGSGTTSPSNHHGGGGTEQDDNFIKQGHSDSLRVDVPPPHASQSNERSNQHHGNQLGAASSSVSTVKDVVKEGKRMISEFLSHHTCYDLLGKSAKVVVFDVNITIRLAYYVLVEHSIGAAPLWDPIAQSIVGMITVTDFVEVLRHGYESNTIRQVIDSHTVGSWRSLIAQLRASPEAADALIRQQVPGVQAAASAARERNSNENASAAPHPKSRRRQPRGRNRQLTYITLNDSLHDTCCTLRDHELHRVPILDDACQTCYGVITRLELLRYLVNRFREDRPLFSHTIGELGIGTFESDNKEGSSSSGDNASNDEGNSSGLVTARADTPLITVLKLIAEAGVSCVPIVDEEGRVINMYSRGYVTQLSKHDNIQQVLNGPVGAVLEEVHAAGGGGGTPATLYTCTRDDSLHAIFLKFNQYEVHRLLCVDPQDRDRLVGIVALSDLLSYFVDGESTASTTTDGSGSPSTSTTPTGEAAVGVATR